jgi:hypothetical protein
MRMVGIGRNLPHATTVFSASCINEKALSQELRRPTAPEGKELARRIPEFKSCIGFIDGMLVKIGRPTREDHCYWYNGRKATYAFNNTVVVDDNGMFIYVDPGYPGFFHNVVILGNSLLYRNWRSHFSHSDGDIEYLLGDPGYIGEEMFIVRRVNCPKIAADGDIHVVDAFNTMHTGHRVQMEWGIGGLKRKWRWFMKKYGLSHDKFPILFQVAAILTNFIQRRRTCRERSASLKTAIDAKATFEKN